MKKLAALLLVVVMIFSLVACGGGKDEKNDETVSKGSVVGKWEYAEENCILVLNEDNSGEMIYGEESLAMTWEYDDASHTVTLIDDGFTDECTYSPEDDTICVDDWVFSRVTE